MMNKKGILPNETVKLVIAVISILILAYLAFSLYGLFSAKTKMQQAKENLDGIMVVIENLKEGDSRDFLISAPKGWYLVYLDGMSIDNCESGKCLCLCSNVQKSEWLGTSSDIELGCNNGYCKIINQEVIASIEIERGVETNIVNLNLELKEGKLHIGAEQGDVAEELEDLTDFWNFKLDENSLTIKELSEKFVKGRDSKDESNLKKAIEEFLNFKYTEKATYWYFYIKGVKSNGEIEETAIFYDYNGGPNEVEIIRTRTVLMDDRLDLFDDNGNKFIARVLVEQYKNG